MTTLNQADISHFGFQWKSAALSALVHIVGIFILLVIPVQVIHHVAGRVRSRDDELAHFDRTGGERYKCL